MPTTLHAPNCCFADVPTGVSQLCKKSLAGWPSASSQTRQIFMPVGRQADPTATPSGDTLHTRSRQPNLSSLKELPITAD